MNVLVPMMALLARSLKASLIMYAYRHWCLVLSKDHSFFARIEDRDKLGDGAADPKLGDGVPSIYRSQSSGTRNDHCHWLQSQWQGLLCLAKGGANTLLTAESGKTGETVLLYIEGLRGVIVTNSPWLAIFHEVIDVFYPSRTVENSKPFQLLDWSILTEYTSSYMEREE